jgi:tRNA(Ile)-lysidine synthase
MFLLYKILETGYKNNLVVCYFNHKTRAETDKEEAFLENLCKKENIAFETASCDFEKIKKLYPSKSFEELAREKRYQFFDAILGIYKTNKILLAHHKDDKIETFFFNLLRGSKLT